ncbi:hypothetical protein Xen7305DRAFT_00020600 [Xenococcus sp. PCC 7305]|nr:hypothetical protein Xen7305DRAFT_00020600 [Xenococcus sp. PCC 7305]
MASTSSSNQAISCQTSGAVPATIAKRADGEALTIFHWKDEVLPEYLNAQELCAEVSQKLQDYAASGHQLSSFKTHDLDGVPLICAEENTGDCSLVLFTLNATNNQGDSNMILGQILDDKLKGEEIISIERGVQFYGYKVNFWSLLGF